MGIRIIIRILRWIAWVIPVSSKERMSRHAPKPYDHPCMLYCVVWVDTYRNFEIVIVENNSEGEDIWEYYKEAVQKYDNIRILYPLSSDRWSGRSPARRR